jgi:glycine cleavage system H protein
MNTPEDLKYTKNDEWVRVNDRIATIGITDHAQDQLSDVVYVELVVAVGDTLSKGDTIASLESVKAAADVYSPVSGVVVEINEALPDSPEMINTDPYGGAWMVKVEMSSPAEVNDMLDAGAYASEVEQAG